MEPVTVALTGYAAWLWIKAQREKLGNTTGEAGDFAPMDAGTQPAQDFGFDAFTDPALTLYGPFTDPLMPETPSSGAVVIDPSGRTRGERNNNPGNIVKSSQSWVGKVPSSDTRFESFSAPEYGIRALVRVLRSYSRQGKNTVNSIIATYAPPSENLTNAYVQHVASMVGVDPDAIIDVGDPATLVPLVRAIITHENGRNIYPDEIIMKGIALA